MQGVGEAGGARVVDADQAVGLQDFEGPEVRVVQAQRQRFGEGEAVQGLAFERAGAAEDAGGALTHGRGQRHRAPPHPFLGARDVRELPPHRAQQVAQQPQIAPAQAVQPVGGERVETGRRRP